MPGLRTPEYMGPGLDQVSAATEPLRVMEQAVASFREEGHPGVPQPTTGQPPAFIAHDLASMATDLLMMLFVQNKAWRDFCAEQQTLHANWATQALEVKNTAAAFIRRSIRDTAKEKGGKVPTAQALEDIVLTHEAYQSAARQYLWFKTKTDLYRKSEDRYRSNLHMLENFLTMRGQDISQVARQAQLGRGSTIDTQGRALPAAEHVPGSSTWTHRGR